MNTGIEVTAFIPRDVLRARDGEFFREAQTVGALNDLTRAGWEFIAAYVVDGQRVFLLRWGGAL
jgi:hypothetical protein